MAVLTSPSTPPRQTVIAADRPIAVAWAVALLLGAAGLVGLVLRLVQGHASADYGSYVPWGLWVAAYVALLATSAGAFLLAALILMVRRRDQYRLATLSLLVALGTFAAGMVNVWLDLGKPLRAWRLVTDTSWSSVMGWMSWLYAVYALLLVVALFALRNGAAPRIVERFAWVGVVVALLAAGAEGSLFAVVGARATWESGLTPVLFIVEAVLFGIGAVVGVAALFRLLARQPARQLAAVLLGLIATVLVIETAEFSTALAASTPAKEAVFRAVLTGEQWWIFWLVHLGLGVALPAALLLSGRARPVRVGVAGAMIALFGVASKFSLVVPALTQEDIAGLGGAFSGPGLAHGYFPSTMEWLVWLGTLGVAAMVVLGGRRFLPGLGLARPFPSNRGTEETV